MKDTLLIGDFLFVNKMAYGYSRYSCEIPFTTISLCPISGRVLAGRSPSVAMWWCSGIRPPGDYIKRLIGLPGDKIQMKEGVLYINGTSPAGAGRHIRGSDGAAGPDAQPSALREWRGGRGRHLHEKPLHRNAAEGRHMTC
jgi:signal peptidase I